MITNSSFPRSPGERSPNRFHLRPTSWLLFALAGGVATRDASADVIADWNAIMQETVSAADPVMQLRSAAIVHLAVFDAVNSIVGDYQPYLEKIPAASGASAEAAAIAAAHRTLVALHPDSTANLDAARAASLAAIADGAAKDHGIAVGVAAADAILALRADDGSGEIVPYLPGGRPGDWQPTPPAFAPAFRPGWGDVAPFGIAKATHFRLGPPPSIRSGRFARAVDEVKDIGDVDSVERPADRTDVAHYYAVVLVVPVWNDVARQVSQAHDLPLADNARMFALLAMAMCDSLIATFETKYHYNFWRPVTAIRAGDSDGNDRTGADPDWLPLITTPPHPSYPSAHASGGGAARRVLEHFLGEDGHEITLSSPAVPGVELHYTTFEQITDDIDDARIYGGIHYRFDQEMGARQGQRVGSYILRHELRPLRGRDCAPRRKR